MKYLVNLTFLLFILVSCNQNAPDTSAFDKGLAMFEKNKAIADKTFDLFIAKDLDGMMDMHSEDLFGLQLAQQILCQRKNLEKG